MPENTQNIVIRKATTDDVDSIWNIFSAVIQTEDSFVYRKETTKQEVQDLWMGPKAQSYVALLDGQIAGTFVIKPVQRDLGSHIANASYMVHPEFKGRRIGKAMGVFSLEEAKRLGYQAMQYNIVVSTNEVAIKLWKSIGFKILGTVPNGFKHQKLGYVDTYIMYRKL